MSTKAIEALRVYLKDYSGDAGMQSPKRYVELFREGLAELEAQPAQGDALDAARWQPIETAPKDGSEILLGTACGIAQGYWDGSWKPSACTTTYDMANAVFYCLPTHWMPLTALPAAMSSEAAKSAQTEAGK